MTKKEVQFLGPAVIIDYHDLLNNEVDLFPSIQEAFGAHDQALGLILIKNVPHLQKYRQELLPLAPKLANLSKESLAQLEDAESQYMFGWSHGKEIMNGKKDIAKGSFYANPTYDVPTTDELLKKEYPEYCHENLWPQDLPDLEPAFKNLGQLMVEVGSLIAKHCDQFLIKQIPDYPNDFLFKMVQETRCNKARLLHYFPKETEDTENDSWCGWHLDHSCLTALTAAMYLDENQPNEEVDAHLLDPTTGLYIRNRGGEVVHVQIPKDCLAFQTGEALEIVSDCKLKATPHCVKSLSSKKRISRNTIALFIQPDWTQSLKPDYSFTSFTKQVLNSHY